MTYPLHSKLNVFPINDTPKTLHAFGHTRLFNKNLVVGVLCDLLQIAVKEGELAMIPTKDELTAEIFKSELEFEKEIQPVKIEVKKEEINLRKKPKGLRYE